MQRRFCLVMTTSTGAERPFPIQKARTVIGRSPMSDVRIPIPSVGSRHCQLILDANDLVLEDLGSNSGTLRNGVRVEQASLGHADQLTIGPVTFDVRVAPADEDPMEPALEVHLASDTARDRMTSSLPAPRPAT